MKTDLLAKLFGSVGRVRLMRLFLFNPHTKFTVAEAGKRVHCTPAEARREIALIKQAGLIRTLTGAKRRYMLNARYPYVEALRELLLTTPMSETDVSKLFREAGSVKYLVLAGVFAGDSEGRVDMLIAGDRLNDRVVRRIVHKLEADMGKEINYAAMSVENLRYRLDVSDRLVRDVFDYPHRVVLDRLGWGLR